MCDQTPISAMYSIEFPIENCTANNVPPSPVTVSIGTGDTALDVLEAAVDVNSGYRFTATYFGSLGYLIDAINGTASKDPCYWFFYYQKPGMEPVFSDVGVSSFVIPEDGYSIIFRYEIYTGTEPGHETESDTAMKGCFPTLATTLLIVLVGFALADGEY